MTGYQRPRSRLALCILIARHSHGIANGSIIGIVSMVEPCAVSLNEALEQCHGHGGIFGCQFGRDLVQPCFEHRTVFACFSVAVVLVGAPPCGQGLLQPRSQLVRTASHLKAGQPRLHLFVCVGQLKQHGAKGGCILPLKEGIERFIDGFGHMGQQLQITSSASCIHDGMSRCP